MQPIENLQMAYEKAAKLVELWGEEFVPTFLRAERMLEDALRGQNAVERARKVARRLSA
ncbi:hypothetical protein PhaeoP72_02313 [Phaeobacter inhibens]|nr:hypothetical protein PhaeoP72_02313 [Phaeobacter inhibens]